MNFKFVADKIENFHVENLRIGIIPFSGQACEIRYTIKNDSLF